MLSILHRMCGGLLIVFAFPVFVWWLLAVNMGPEAYDTFLMVADHWMGRIYTTGLMFCAYYHLCNGVRHLIWDAGFGLGLKTAQYLGLAALALSVILTGATLLCLYSSLIYGGTSL